jgi:hypothetical protein
MVRCRIGYAFIAKGYEFIVYGEVFLTMGWLIGIAGAGKGILEEKG